MLNAQVMMWFCVLGPGKAPVMLMIAAAEAGAEYRRYRGKVRP